MAHCERMATCGLLTAYGEEIACTMAEMLSIYCTGDQADACARKRYRQQHGAPPADALLPTGAMFRPKER